jgi:hypothetical protein
MANRIETIDDLQAVLDAQTAIITALGELVKAMDARIQTLTTLLDGHHEIFIKHGLARPRPSGDSLAN